MYSTALDKTGMFEKAVDQIMKQTFMFKKNYFRLNVQKMECHTTVYQNNDIKYNKK